MAAPSAASPDVQSLPASCTSYRVNVVGFVGFMVVSFILREFSGLSTTTLVLLSLPALALPLIIIELSQRRIYTRQSSGLDFGTPQAVNWARVAVKLYGFMMTFAIIAALYWLLPEYHRGFYAPFWRLLEVTLPVFLLASIPYFIIIDRYMPEPYDGYWHAGMLLLGRLQQVDRKLLLQYALGWLVKAFFIPLMYVMYLRSYQFFFGCRFCGNDGLSLETLPVFL
jgi:hypothetical protein